MQEYYFLFALALVWAFFAAVQDIKTREVANWLNFSLIAFALAYRAFYSLFTNNYNFFLLGFLGFLFFFCFANLFYYTKIFAGGDAKLLMGCGVILPYTNYSSIITFSLLFLLLLFLIGAIYSLGYSIFIVAENKEIFSAEFKKRMAKQKYQITLSFILFIITLLLSLLNPLSLFFSLIFLLLPIYAYTSSLDKCMLSLVPAEKLTEGDWIEADIKVGKTIIKKTIHGLSLRDIQILKKYRKQVLIKKGIPFVPVFFVTILLTVFFLVTSKFAQLFLSLF